MVCCACGDSTLEPSKVLSVAPEKQLRRLLLGTEARVTMPDVKQSFLSSDNVCRTCHSSSCQ